MVDGQKNSHATSYDNYLNSLPDIDSVKDNDNNNIGGYDLKENLMLCWTGDLVSLKQFIEANFDLNGKWKSPGDKRRNKKKLHFQRCW